MRPHFLLLGLLLVVRASAIDYFVSPKGNDANPGTIEAPWKTVQRAANTLQPGDTVFLRKGIYRELVTINVSGTAGAPITFTNYAAEKAILDATGIAPPEEDRAILFIDSKSHLVIRGLEVRNFATTKADRQPSGIFITGASHDIELRGNNVHHIRNTHKDGNAFGIAVYGTSAAQAVTGLVIDGNEVHHLKTGNSESLVLNGNVSGFVVSNNRVHDNNNIGLCFIGFEQTCPTPSLDRARDGVCRGNTVWNISSRANPSYAGGISADGIYCDGAANVLIERNVVYLADIGIELASEHAGGDCTGCTVRDNFISRCRLTGIALGGYDAQRGATRNCTVTNNTFSGNDTMRSGSGEVLLQHFLSGNVLRQNIFAAGTQGLFVSSLPASTDVTIFDYNCYFVKKGAEWAWRGGSPTSFAEWQAASGQDAHSIFADPKFVAAARGNLHLAAGSPAIDAGDPTFATGTNETDIDNAARVVGSRVDLGADEFQP